MIVRRVGDETVVYDRATYQAHCLDRVAGLVFARCDGATPVPALAGEVAELLGGVSRGEADRLVRRTLLRLEEVGLLDGRRPPAATVTGRRSALAGLAATSLVPVIASILAPAPAEAATCVPQGGTCASSQQCCPEAACCRAAGPPGSPPRCRPGGGACIP